MYYRDFKGLSISRLGMGNMRLPTVGSEMGSPVDREKAQEIIDYVYANGVNYFDTAFMYHGGQSEVFLGEALKKYPRDSYFLADKMPGFMLEPGQGPEVIFEEQLRRCQTDYFDFYLCHNVSETSVDVYNDESVGIIPYLIKQREEGRIRHLGFSSHGNPETLRSFLDKWDGVFEFVQIQLNYLDWTLQDAKQQYEIITGHGLPVWVMEPCRGGRLAALDPESDTLLKAAAPEASIASWAFRFVQDLPGVQVILSGMTQLEQAVDNIATFSEYRHLSEVEEKVLWKAVDIFRAKFGVPCTACHYCDGCPMGLDIPALLSVYNQFSVEPSPGIFMSLERLGDGQLPEKCIGCGQCARKCPQGIDIPGTMAKFAAALNELPRPER